jgi:hypothetical protein
MRWKYKLDARLVQQNKVICVTGDGVVQKEMQCNTEKGVGGKEERGEGRGKEERGEGRGKEKGI